LTVEDEIAKQRLLSPGATVIVGFSGGADSVALLHALHGLGCRCVAAHCNFHLRGEESMRDEAFARAFADTNGICFEKIDFDTRRYASEQKISVEMAARDLRYGWFESLRTKHNAEAIAVAHHRDDNVETALLNLIRGTGIRGLTGMAVRSGHVVRPLLGVGKRDILDYLTANGLTFVTDSSNLTFEHTRNIVRGQVLPLLQTINPSITDAVERTIRHLLEVEKVYDGAIAEAKRSAFIPADEDGTVRIDMRAVQAFASPEALLYELLSGYDFGASVIRDVVRSLSGGQSGKLFYSSSHRLLKDRDFLILTPVDTANDPCAEFFISEDDDRITYPISLTIETLPASAGFSFTADQSTAYFDRAMIRFPLHLRRWRAGDIFVPFGMQGRQKIGKYFKDHLFSLAQKEAAWLLCSGEDVIWIVGERADNRYRVRRETQQVLVVKTDLQDKLIGDSMMI
jgi:tRNA(Ile)-lysidine synthase